MNTQASLTESEIISFLGYVKEQGIEVIVNRPPVYDGWTIFISPKRWIAITESDRSKGLWTVIADAENNIIGDVSTETELRDLVSGILRMNGYTLQRRIVPALTRLRSIAGTRSLSAFADDYFGPGAVRNLIEYVKEGGTLDRKVRVLITDRRASTALAEDVIADFTEQTGSTLEMRRDLRGDHPRMVILHDGVCLSPDFSLNDVSRSAHITSLLNSKWALGEFKRKWAHSR
jgi:hypothetical protein